MVNEKKPGENDVDEITGQTLVAGSNDNNEDNNDKIKKNRLINQKFKVGDGNNDDNDDNNGDNDNIALRTNSAQLVDNTGRASKRRFKIRRSVFVKVKKNNSNE